MLQESEYMAHPIDILRPFLGLQLEFLRRGILFANPTNEVLAIDMESTLNASLLSYPIYYYDKKSV